MSIYLFGLGGGALAVLLIIGLMAFAVACLSVGGRLTIGAFLVASVFVVPVPLYGGGGSYNEIAPSSPVLITSIVAVLICLVAILVSNRSLHASLVIIPLGLYLLAGYIFIWPGDSVRASGVFLLACACLAWFVGANLFEWCFSVPRAWLITNLLLLLVVATQTIVCGFQYMEFSSGGGAAAVADGVASDLTGRTSGTFAHPGTLGKLLFVIVSVSVVALESVETAVRRVALATILCSFVCVVLTQSRANIAALGVMVCIFLILSRSPERIRNREKRVAWVFLVIAGLVGVSVISARFAADPNGGERSHFLQVGLDQFWRAPAFGVGPNSYILEAGAYDRLTAEGWPVHNTILLIACELGVVGLISFALPFLASIARAIPRLRERSLSGSYARVAIASVPGLVIVLGSGWGMLNLYVVIAWFMASGFIYRGIVAPYVGYPDEPSEYVSTTVCDSRSAREHSILHTELTKQKD
ncbi:O-antigen ligase family protein [Gordonia alkanivorans]|uniref:O-antigen ligase family protein n=1 Tax=Gordonia alkanivorans TaxID=84096 RepID=UPI001F4DDBA5|nr:O-antigen ligase family protein [Gordonia alkanivorans]